MGSVAHLRQAMLDADHQHALELDAGQRRDRARRSTRRFEALWPARNRKLPVWWEANTRDEIHRALDLAEEFGTTAVIVGGREAAKVVDRLKAQRVAGRPPARLPRGAQGPDRGGVPQAAADRAGRALEGPGPPQASDGRSGSAPRRSWPGPGSRSPSRPTGLERLESVPGPDPRAHRRRACPPIGRWRRSRRQAADIAGLDRRLGTLEPGKLGHLVAFTAPFRDEKAKVRVRPRRRPEVRDQAARARTAEGRPGARGARARGEPRSTPPASVESSAKGQPRPDAKPGGPRRGRSRARRKPKPDPKPEESRASSKPERSRSPSRSPTRSRSDRSQARPKPSRRQAEPEAKPDRRPSPRPSPTEDQARPKPAALRSSTSPPSSTRTASRRSRPAATS